MKALDKHGKELFEGDFVNTSDGQRGQVIIIEGDKVFVRFKEYIEIGDVVENIMYDANILERI